MERKFLSIGMMAGTAVEKYRNLQRGCCETWIPMCDKVYLFCGKHYDFDFEGEMVNLTDRVEFVHFNDVGEDYESASPKFWRGLLWLYLNEPADWYCIVGSDNYCRYDKIVEMLQQFDGKSPLTLGGSTQYRMLKHKGVDVQIPFNIGGGGSFITHAALEIILNKYEGDPEMQIAKLLDEWQEVCSESKRPDLPPACDVCLGWVSWELDIPMVAIRGLCPIDWTGYQYWHMNGCFFSFNRESIIICHYMNRYLQHSYHKYLGYSSNIEDITDEYLNEKYNSAKDTCSDINEHVQTLYEYAKECKTIASLGAMDVSGWGFLKGLVDNEGGKIYCINPKSVNINTLKEIGDNIGVEVKFIQGDTDKTDLPEEIDMLFIDSEHNAGKNRRELSKHHANIRKYIVFHDSEIDRVISEHIRCGHNLAKISEVSGIPIWELAQGIQFSIEEFLVAHPEWMMDKVYTNNNGLTILKRISE